ncbi:4995_t:CDS:1, partial [Funneliformis geosporum]
IKNQIQSLVLDIINVATNDQLNQVIKLLKEQSDTRLPSNNNFTKVNTIKKYSSTKC